MMKSATHSGFALNPLTRRPLAILTVAVFVAACHAKSDTGPDATKADPAPPIAGASQVVAQNDQPPASASSQLAAPDPNSPPGDASAQQAVSPAVTSQFRWPRTYKDGTTTLLVYQPEIEKWDGFNFQARFAVSIQDASQPAPTFGVMWVTANSNVDKEEGIVTLTNIKITKSNFPTEPNNAKKYTAFLTTQIPAQSVPIPLAQIDNKFALGQAIKKVAAQPVKNTPPKIIFSDEPALLILIDGNPVLRPLAGTNCNRIFNTNALIVQNATDGGPYYLRALNYWYKSDSLEGPWTVDPDAANSPSFLPSVLDAALATKQVDPINPPAGQNPPPPDIYVSTVPAELVQTQGQPQFVPIHNTALLEVRNSDNAIILDIGNQLFYVLISGRWFCSPAITGSPWTYVPGDKLPADFAKIPPNSDKGNVLVSVPGTPQAEEAVIANSIPQTATVNRQQANLTVDYDGAPQFQSLEGTSLQYAVNTVTPVIEVKPSSFYAVSNAVWFTASTPLGPWTVATSVPAAIYTIPISSPLHYVTYVQVYGYTDSVVYVGYTPGYYGTVVTPGGVVVYGSGYSYPPYIGNTVYVAPPPTYGYGAGFADGSASGFLFGFAAGAIVGACLSPNWGCWGGNTYNTTINTGCVYNSWGNHVVTTGPAYGYHDGSSTVAGFNPYNGNWAAARNGAVYNPSTGTYASGHSSAYGNAYTGNYGGNRQGSAYNPSTGRSASGSSSISGNAYNGNWNANQNRSYYDNKTGVSASSSKTASGNAYNGTASEQINRSASAPNGSSISSQVDKSTGEPTTRSGTAYNANTGQTKTWDHTQGQGTHDASTPSRAYSDSSGNVYKPSSDGSGYQKATSSGWQDADHSQTQNLDRQSQASGDGSRWGGDSGGGDRWGGGGGDRWGGGGDRWGGGGGGGRWGGGGGGGRWGGGGGRSWR
jgi:hypothetical protein